MFNSLLARLLGGSFEAKTDETRTDDAKTGTVPAEMQVGLRAMSRKDAHLHAEHLLRLPSDDRRTRFFRSMNDDSLRRYSAGLDWSRTIVVGAFFGGVVRGVGELVLSADGEHAEIAVSVERDFRHLAVGRLLFTSLLVEARLRHLREVRLDYLRENDAMGALARDAGAQIVSHAMVNEGVIPLVRVPMAPVRPPSSAPQPDPSFPS